MTNFERIKEMSVEELAKSILEIAHVKHLPEQIVKEYAVTRKTYEECIIKWLNSESNP